jgi:hypothetical protein
VAVSNARTVRTLVSVTRGGCLLMLQRLLLLLLLLLC